MNRKPFRFLTINIHGESAFLVPSNVSMTYMMPKKDIPDSVNKLTRLLSQMPFPQWEGPAIPLPIDSSGVPDLRPDSMAVDYFGDGNFVMYIQHGSTGWPCMRWGALSVEVNESGTPKHMPPAMYSISHMIAQAYAPVNQEEKEAFLQDARKREAEKNQSTFGKVEVYLKETNGLFWKKEFMYVIDGYHFTESEIEKLEENIKEAKAFVNERKLPNYN
jgi:hypothetical protein